MDCDVEVVDPAQIKPWVFVGMFVCLLALCWTGEVYPVWDKILLTHDSGKTLAIED